MFSSSKNNKMHNEKKNCRKDVATSAADTTDLQIQKFAPRHHKKINGI